MPKKTPIEKGENGRAANGQFAKGWKGGPGNPNIRHATKMREAVYASVCERDIRDAVDQLVKLARGGDLAAIKELLDRTIGKAVAPVDLNIQGGGPPFVIFQNDFYGRANLAAFAVAPSANGSAIPSEVQGNRGGPAVGQNGNGTHSDD